MKTKQIKTTIFITGCSLTFFMSGCSMGKAAEVYYPMPQMNAQKQSETIMATVMQGDLKEEKTINLLAKAGQESSLSFHVSDIAYDAFYVSAGDQVKKGQILARLYCEDLIKPQREAQLSLEEAKIRLSMQKGLFDQYAMNKTDYERSVSDLQNEIKALQEEIQEYDVRIKERTIFADMDGYVKSVSNVDLSQGSQEGREIFTLCGGDMEYTASVSDLAGLTVGKTYEMNVNESVIDVTLDSAQKEDTVYKLVFTPADSRSQSDSDVTASGKITYVTHELKNVLYVDQLAVTKVGDISYVYYEKDGTRQARQVTTGPVINGYYVIKDGVTEGEELICD